jgi:putative transposase
MAYLSLLREYVSLYERSLLGYCLMSNNVHLVVIPRAATSLALVCKQTHGRYATYWNVRHKSTGHAWQARFYSCPMDQAHLWSALRYTERNPVRGRVWRRRRKSGGGPVPRCIAAWPLTMVC